MVKFRIGGSIGVITKKQKATILQDYKGMVIKIINIISKSSGTSEEKMKLVSFLLLLKDVLDLENERLDYEKIQEGSNG